MPSKANNHEGPAVHTMAGLSIERQASIRAWLENSAPRERDHQIEHALRQGGPEAEFIRRLLSHETRRRGESPDDKQSRAPQTK